MALLRGAWNGNGPRAHLALEGGSGPLPVRDSRTLLECLSQGSTYARELRCGDLSGYSGAPRWIYSSKRRVFRAFHRTVQGEPKECKTLDLGPDYCTTPGHKISTSRAFRHHRPMATAPPYRPPGSAGGRYLVRRVRTGSSPARDPGEPGCWLNRIATRLASGSASARGPRSFKPWELRSRWSIGGPDRLSITARSAWPPVPWKADGDRAARQWAIRPDGGCAVGSGGEKCASCA